MRILFLSFYYQPDLCAGSFRATALIHALQHEVPEGSHIDVLTTMPNRYSSFIAAAYEFEETGPVSIRRIHLPPHKSGMRDQSKAFFSYVRSVREHVRNQKYDLVFATSSRLMTAVLGAYVARGQKVPLYLDIRDIFVDTIRDILPFWPGRVLGGLFSVFERYAIGYASKVNLVSRGFDQYFSKRYPRQQFAFFPNGIDDQFIGPVTANTTGMTPNPPYSVLYAGNLGDGQGLQIILPELARSMRGLVKFTIIGDGGRKAELAKKLADAGIDNVTLCDPVSRDALAQAYLEADVLFLHLNDHDAFRKVLPSKLFEYAAIGKPIWAGVAGYAAAFISEEIENACTFPPCDAKAAAQAFSKLKLETASRDDFVRKYRRQNIMKSLASDIVQLVRVDDGACMNE